MSSSSSLDAPEEAPLSPFELFGWPFVDPVALFDRLHLQEIHLSHSIDLPNILFSLLTLLVDFGTTFSLDDHSDSAPSLAFFCPPATDIYDSRISAPSFVFVGAWSEPDRLYASSRKAASDSWSTGDRRATFSMKTLEWQKQEIRVSNIWWFIIKHESISDELL